MEQKQIEQIMIDAQKEAWPGREGFFGWPPGVPPKYKKIVARTIFYGARAVAQAMLQK